MARTAALCLIAFLLGGAVGVWDQGATGPAASLIALAGAGLVLAALATGPSAAAASILCVAGGVMLANAAAPQAPDIDLRVLDRAILSAMVAAVPATLGAALGIAAMQLAGARTRPPARRPRRLVANGRIDRPRHGH